MKKIIVKPLIIDKDKGVIAVWNCNAKRYIKLSFELVDDLHHFTHSPKLITGVVYKKIKL